MEPFIPVLTISGHDPTGGAGIQADIEAILSQGCHPCSLITSLTTQDTRNIQQIFPQPPEAFNDQMEALFADIPIRAVKIGLLGSATLARQVASGLRKHQPEIIVLDPVLQAGGGANLADSELIEIIHNELLPLVTVVTPNRREALRLTGTLEIMAGARKLLDKGCQAVLITGGDDATPLIYNTLYHANGIKTFTWERLPLGAHGSGCTLASALTALLAKGLPLEEATRKAQQYTWNTIKYAYRPGRGQPIPYHLFWS